MSSAVDLAITEVAQQLEETLRDGVAAYREGEVRATFKKVHDLTITRHELLVQGGYVFGRGRYKGTLKETEESSRSYPGQSSQALYQLYLDNLLNDDSRLAFQQLDEDTKTSQSLRHLNIAGSVLFKEFTPLGEPERTDNLFGPARQTLRGSNFYPTGTGCEPC